EEGGVVRRCGRGLAGVSVVAVLGGCDPLYFLDEVVKPVEGRREGTGAQELPRVESVVGMRRADLLTVVVSGKTQEVHLAGVCAPSRVAGRYNKQFAERAGLRVEDMAGHGCAALRAARGLLARGGWRMVTFGMTTNGGRVRMAVDFVDERNESMTAKLLARGHVMRYGEVPRTMVDYEGLELGARRQEVGMWRHWVPLGRRVSVTSRFEREVVRRECGVVYEQRTQVRGRASEERKGAVLERHENVEERGVIRIEVRVEPPITRDYRLEARYRFLVVEERGRDQQVVNELVEDGKERWVSKPMLRGGVVKELAEGEEGCEEIVVTGAVTEVVIGSAPMEYTKSEKAGIAYMQGERVIGYELEVRMGTGVVYCAREEM
ncbi:MAG: hypothetical protein N2595_04905, partial [bacterium]|nr:hypothetical protein [bacterium]